MEERRDESKIIFKVYDCPNELASKYISWAKLYENNQVWKVMEKAMKSLENTKMDVEDFVELQAQDREFMLSKIAELQNEINALKAQPEPKEPEIKTFGRKE